MSTATRLFTLVALLALTASWAVALSLLGADVGAALAFGAHCHRRAG